MIRNYYLAVLSNKVAVTIIMIIWRKGKRTVRVGLVPYFFANHWLVHAAFILVSTNFNLSYDGMFKTPSYDGEGGGESSPIFLFVKQ